MHETEFNVFHLAQHNPAPVRADAKGRCAATVPRVWTEI
jgi:hypothetical protein